jgi:5-methylcytosine-specific restriction endonuclease McrA
MVARLLKRDGATCWLCALPLRHPPKRPNKRISLEHLTPRSLAGGDVESNLVLCHQHCNKHLADHPLEEKLAMRKKWHATARKLAAAGEET